MSFKKIIYASVAIIVLTFTWTCATKAAVCGSSPDGLHHMEHVAQPAGYHVDMGTHGYLWGYNADGTEDYHYDCRKTDVYQYCRYQCANCHIGDGSADHSHYVKTLHSVDH